jgi:hypothetical protein
MDAISKYYDFEIIYGQYISIYIYIHCLHLNIGIFVFVFFCVRLQGTTKEAFVANAIQLAFEHYQQFIHHHVAKVVEATTKYRTNMGITFSSSSEED